jgi:hypothetical protein
MPIIARNPRTGSFGSIFSSKSILSLNQGTAAASPALYECDERPVTRAETTATSQGQRDSKRKEIHRGRGGLPGSGGGGLHHSWDGEGWASTLNIDARR